MPPYCSDFTLTRHLRTHAARPLHRSRLLAAFRGHHRASGATVGTRPGWALPRPRSGSRVRARPSTRRSSIFAFSHYQQAHPDVAVSDASVGSSAGITRYAAGKTVYFGATDVPASAKDLTEASDGSTVQVPVDLGAVDVAYNVPVLNGAETPALSWPGSSSGRSPAGMTRRSPPSTPARTCPDLHTVVHRSDGSGTTYIFSNYLSHGQPNVGRQGRHRPAWTGRPATAGPVTRCWKTISRIPYSIGYVERFPTRPGPALGAAAIQNRVGNYVTPTEAASRPMPRPGPPNHPDKPFRSSTSRARPPIPSADTAGSCSLNTQASQANGQALVNLITWLTGTAGSPTPPASVMNTPRSAIQQLAASHAQSGHRTQRARFTS